MTDSSSLEIWRRNARATAGEDYAHVYAERFDALALAGKDIDGEAAFVASLVPPGSAVLDAGCGTGRIASKLAELGYEVAGVDIDDAMIAVARERSPAIRWAVADLADLDLGTTYDVVILAGNVIPFVDEKTLPEVARRLAAHTKSGGLVACGYGFDRDHLPPGAPIMPLAAYDRACVEAGLTRLDRYAGWGREPYEGETGGYAVSVHRRD